MPADVYYTSATPTLTDGQMNHIRVDQTGRVITSPGEAKSLDLSALSPSTSGTTVSTSGSGLSGWSNLAIEATLTGQTSTGASIGGTLDVYLQCGTDWTDYVHFAQIAASAAPVKYRYVPALNDSITTVGSGLTPALAAGSAAGGHTGDQVRVLYVTSSSTSASGSQTIKVVGVGSVA